MKTFKKLKFLLFFITTFLTISIGYSQNMMQGDPGPAVANAAKEATDIWIKELGLTTKQALLMEKKITEYAMKKEEVLQSKMREEAKTERLIALQILEHKDMRDILTKPQYERYFRLQKERMEQENRHVED